MKPTPGRRSSVSTKERRQAPSANNALPAACLEDLDRELADERQEHCTASTYQPSDVAVSAWIGDYPARGWL